MYITFMINVNLIKAYQAWDRMTIQTIAWGCISSACHLSLSLLVGTLASLTTR